MPVSTDRSPRGWSSGAILRAVALFFLVFLSLKFLWIARSIFIVGFLGVLFGLALARAVDVAERWGMKRGLAAAAIVLIFFATLTGVGALVAPTLKEQMAELKVKLPQAVDKIEEWINQQPALIATVAGGAATPQSKPAPVPGQKKEPSDPAAGGAASPEKSENPQSAQQGKGTPPPVAEKPKPSPPQKQEGDGSLRSILGKQLGGVASHLFPFISGTLAAVGGLLLIVFIALYIAADPKVYREGLLHLIPHKARPRGKEVLHDVGEVLRSWLVARLMAMVAIGLLTGLALMLIKVRAAAALGLIAGLLEFIPFFGPLMSAIPAIASGLVDSPQKAMYVILVFIVIQQIEGNVVTPLLLQKRVDIPPALTIVGVAALGAIFGFLGLLIAEPLLAVALVLVKLLYVEDQVGDQVGEAESKAEGR